jgi:exosortase family protein XrtF
MSFSPAEKTIIRFIGIFIGLILLWYLVYDLLIHPWGKLDTLIINNCSRWSLVLLEFFGYTTFMGNHPTIRTVGIDGTGGLWIGDPCDGLTIFAIFCFFILAFPGKWKHRIWFIPVGILLLHFFNILRIAVLCIILYKKPAWLNFNHTYLFQILMYGLTFILWYVWIKRFSGMKLQLKKEDENQS